ncbi:PfkB family carbohydrate kinase [Kribbella sancticallisti]|uniref:PfkB family carbohydrate kinase n=1 Tax=Kribbella sancticallisti TaxID=460087 RepID=A0ABP4NYF3_9ACTN
MAEHNGEWEPPSALVLTHVLEKMRARDGLTLARLRDDRGQAAAPLLQLHATQRFSNVYKVDLASAAHGVISQCVLETIDGTHRIVADTVLALGLFAEQYSQHGIDDRVVQGLQADSLGTRRNMLLGNWTRLHESMGLGGGVAPSDRTLRGTTEPEVLRELARQLIRREVNSVGARSVVAPTAGDAAGNGAAAPTGRVIVVGGAVMDATFRTKTLPQSETSSEAYGFDLSPGGKGVSQAVAAARLGLEVALVAAVADDRFGQEIVHYLRDEGVNTSHLKMVRQARTPFTGVIEMELGDSIAVNWRNQMEVRLDVRDLEHLSQELTECDAVLVTFEIPRETVQRTLELVHAAERNRPLVIVTPGQPYPDDDISRHSLSQIDYMVAHAWELGRYSPPGQDRFDPDPVARHLLAYGVETLCIPGNGGCTIYSDTDLQTFSVPSFPSIYKESSAARDAFCAALAAQLIDNDRIFSEEQALWATAAMACATADFPLSNSMPDRRRVEALLSRSRFTVRPHQ